MKTSIVIKAHSIQEYKSKLEGIKLLGFEIEETSIQGYFSQENLCETRSTNSKHMVEKYGIQHDDFFRSESYHKVDYVGHRWIGISVGEDKGEIRFPLYPEEKSYAPKAAIVITCRTGE